MSKTSAEMASKMADVRCYDCGQKTNDPVWLSPDGPAICPACELLEQDEAHELEYLRDRDDG